MAFNIILTKPGRQFYEACAEKLAGQLRSKPAAVIGLSTGRTTGGIHQAFVRLHSEEGFDVSGAFFFGLDEVTGVSPDYQGSCVHMLLSEFIRPLGLPDDRLLMLPTHSDDWTSECLSFRERLSALGGIDLLLLGLGENGHLGFNQPGTPFTQRAFASKMDKALERRIRDETQTPDGEFLGGATLGTADILESRALLLCANGENKAEILKKALYGEITEAVPASVLQRFDGLTVICDSGAASQLEI